VVTVVAAPTAEAMAAVASMAVAPTVAAGISILAAVHEAAALAAGACTAVAGVLARALEAALDPATLAVATAVSEAALLPAVLQALQPPLLWECLAAALAIQAAFPVVREISRLPQAAALARTGQVPRVALVAAWAAAGSAQPRRAELAAWQMPMAIGIRLAAQPAAPARV